MTTNPIKEKLAAGQPVLGMWSIISSPMVIEIFGLAGFDFLILDMEHGIFDVAALDAGVRACESTGCAPIVRTPGLSPSAAQWALDAGAYGLIVPQVSGVADVIAAVETAKFPPLGRRGYNPFTRAAHYANPPSNQVGKLNNDFVLTAVIVENEISVRELDRILETEDLDVIYIGVYDLSVALGCNGNTTDPKIQDIVVSCVEKIRTAGKAAGLMVRSQADIAKALALGANFLVYGVDTNVVLQAGTTAVGDLRACVSEAARQISRS